MGGRGAQSGMNSSPAVAQTPSTPVAAVHAGTGRPSGPITYTNLTHADAAAIKNVEDAIYGASVEAARKMYISNTNFDGKGHSMSQSMNYLLNQGVDLTKPHRGYNASQMASMDYTDKYMQRGMHDLGYNAILQRGAHVDDLAPFGITNLNNMSDSQLKAAMVGKTVTTTSYMSTSYDIKSNPFLSSSSGSGVSGGREVVFEIRAHSGTDCMLGSKKQTEVILNKGLQYKVIDAYFTGQTATPRNGSPMKQVKVIIEIL